MTENEREKLQTLGRAVLETEARGVSDLLQRVNEDFAEACLHMLACEGRIVVTGMGKSGHIGSKIAATLASTGSPSFFVHPGEASHGDLGMITQKDVVMALSNSGETGEILAILPLIKRLGVPLIGLTGRPTSTLATEATVNIDVSVGQEACPLGLAPTASTTAALAMGDALAISLLEHRGFTEEDFARSHPGGALGRRLLLLISDIMHEGEAVPRVRRSALLRDVLVEVTDKGLGMTAVVDDSGKIEGVFTDGDLRRILDREIDVHTTEVGDVISGRFITARSDMLAAEGLATMQEHKINALLVVDNNDELVGALNMHDMLRAGVL